MEDHAMSLVKTYSLTIIFSALLFSFAHAANIYVDKTLSSDCTKGNYSIANRNCSGSDGNAYNTVQRGLNAMRVGDHLYLRGGTYREGHIRIPTTINGRSWNDGQYNLIASYPGEWAILDGKGTLSAADRGTVMGNPGFPGGTLSYWKFERLEITGGGSTETDQCAGFWAPYGPFWFRLCYIHDNYVRTGINPGANNPGGLTGHCWQDSIVEYCYFKNNGGLDSDNHNTAHINIYSDYQWNIITKDGFNPSSNNGRHNMRNTYRYNYFDTSRTAVGIKYKGGQYFSGKTTSTSTDTYKNWGDNIHHNIFIGALYSPIYCTQDFVQIHHNIIDNCSNGFILGDISAAYTLYKAVTYNNTVIGTERRSFFRRNEKAFDGQMGAYYGYDYNNIIDSAVYYDSNEDMSINNAGWEAGEDSYSNYVGDRNYFYRPRGTTTQQNNVYSIPDGKYYTVTTYMSLYPGKIIWKNSYDADNLLYAGTAGADKYKVRVGHTIYGSTTVAKGGRGGSHPYLSGITLPSYIGACDPNDSSWVNTVLGLSNVNNLRSGGGSVTSIPTPTDANPPKAPLGIGIQML